jgi:hypothetical protein
MTQSNKLVVAAGFAMSLAASAFAADNNRAYAAELLSDAGARVSLLDGGSGYDKGGFMIGSADGQNSLYVFGSAQIRYYANFRDTATEEGENDENDFTHGFENRLTRLGVRGSVWDKNFTYQVRGEFNNGGDFGLETAFAHYRWENGFGVMAGQFKHPLFREAIVDNEYQLAVERSVTEGLFTGGGYTQGLQFTYESDAFRAWFGFTDGVSSSNTPFNSGTTRAGFTDGGEADYALNARGEFKVMGSNWERFNDFTSWKSAEDTGLIIGAAIHWQSSGDTGGTGGVDADGNEIPGLEAFYYTIDAQAEGQGWNAFAAFLGARQDSDAENSDSTDNFGLVIQAGIFVTDQVELFGRWDGIFFDGSGTDGDEIDDQHFITAGVNYYLSPESHAAKLTADVVYAVEQTAGLFAVADTDAGIPGGALAGGTNYGLLGTTEDGEFAIRLQLQVVY